MSPLLDHLRKLFRPPPRPYTKVETYGAIPCRELLPKRAGDYNVVVDGLSSVEAIFIWFDGKAWDETTLRGYESEFGAKRQVRWFPNDPNGGPFKRGSRGVPL
jgi:hypothetical protein